MTPTTSLCGQCKRAIPATIVDDGGRVVMRKTCEEHGAQEVLVADDAAWYRKIMALPPVLTAPEAKQPVSQGCPFDCGPCSQHQQAVQLPIVPITSACNLDCPICYTHNKNEGAWHMSDRELEAVLAGLRAAAPERRIINLTGGEPTQHPDFVRIIEACAREGIHRITVSTHGLRFLKEEHLAARLAELGARVILSFDSFKPEVNRAMLGGDHGPAKLRVLEILARHGVNTTLLPVIARGQNDDELGRFVELTLERPNIRSLELHTMTFTGQGGQDFDRRGRYTSDQVLRDLAAQTFLRVDDFVPSPAAHPLCYQVTYLLELEDGRWLPLPRFMSWEELRALLGSSLYMEPSTALEDKLGEIINRLYAEDGSELILRAMRRLADALYAADPGDRLHAAERHTKAIYLHAHMDEESFDTDRIRMCPVGIREPDGRNIPSCAYNVLYRERDARYMEEPRPALVQLGRGSRAP